MRNLRSLYFRNRRKTAGNMLAVFFWHKKVSKEILFLVFFSVVGQVFHPEGVDSSLFAVIYLSMIFICLRVCFIILFTCVPLSAPHLSPTHGFICSTLLSVCLSLCACPTTVIFTLSSPAWKISSFIRSGFISYNTPLKPSRGGSELPIILHLFLLSPSLILLFSCGQILLKLSDTTMFMWRTERGYRLH